jgi:Flp pilus assembly pilin Flp
MVADMKVGRFIREDEGVIAVEYIVFLAGIGTVLIIGVALLFNALSTFFGSWATYFGG